MIVKVCKGVRTRHAGVVRHGFPLRFYKRSGMFVM